MNNDYVEKQEDVVALYDELLVSINELKEKMDSVGLKCAGLENQNRSLKEEIDKNKKTISEWSTQLANDRTMMDGLNGILSAASSQVEKCKKDNEQLNGSIAFWSKKLEEDKKEMELIHLKLEKQSALLDAQQKTLLQIITKAEGTIKQATAIDKSISNNKEKAINEIKKLAETSLTNLTEYMEGSKDMRVSDRGDSMQQSRARRKQKTVDYDDVDTIEGLFNKYADKTNPLLIVHKEAPSSWTADYCFVVKSLSSDGENAYGNVFIDGEPYLKGRRKYPARSDEYKVYNGRYKDKITKYFDK